MTKKVAEQLNVKTSWGWWSYFYSGWKMLWGGRCWISQVKFAQLSVKSVNTMLFQVWIKSNRYNHVQPIFPIPENIVLFSSLKLWFLKNARILLQKCPGTKFPGFPLFACLMKSQLYFKLEVKFKLNLANLSCQSKFYSCYVHSLIGLVTMCSSYSKVFNTFLGVIWWVGAVWISWH